MSILSYFIPLALLIYLLLMLYCLVEALKKHRELYWTAIIIVLPGLGIAAYLANFHLLPVMGKPPLIEGLAEKRRLREMEEIVRETGIEGTRLELVEELYRLGRWMEGLRALQPLLDADPENLRYQFLAARGLFESGRPADALQFIEYVLQREPGYAWGEGTLLKGRVLEELGKEEDALECYESLRERTRLAEGIVRAAQLRLVRGEADEARRELKEMIEDAEKHPGINAKRDEPWLRKAREMLRKIS